MTESELVGRALGRLFEALERPVEPIEGQLSLEEDDGGGGPPGPG